AFARLILSFGHLGRARRKKLRQYLTSRELTIANSRHQVFRTAEPVIRSHSVQVFVFDLFQSDTIFARLLFNQLAANFNRPLPLMYIQPMLDLIAGSR